MKVQNAAKYSSSKVLIRSHLQYCTHFCEEQLNQNIARKALFYQTERVYQINKKIHSLLMYQHTCTAKWRNIQELPKLSCDIRKKKPQQSWYCCLFVIIQLFVQWNFWPRLNSFHPHKHCTTLPVCIKRQSAVRSMWSLIKYLLHWKKTLKTSTPARAGESKMLMSCPLDPQATKV